MNLVDYAIEPDKFALSCVASSSSQLSVKEKLEHYKKAYEEAFSFSKQIEQKQAEKEHAERVETAEHIKEFFSFD